ncbi:MAG: hypothetical protein BJ554DRAFT_8415 [Olpidium bornovanus]|uniref:Uncharacterized protein n=1 Tax=Olpidium bornovanus TaxID=278681 RepID=A0A8H8DIM2_9FUNG|nr:MAG: hypothetical protein BJ554DRAFT_8415 [Olpidium bornovanus]
MGLRREVLFVSLCWRVGAVVPKVLRFLFFFFFFFWPGWGSPVGSPSR